MRIQVSGKQIDIGEALQGHVSSHLAESAAKYAGRPTEGNVVFSRDGFLMACEITVHLSTGLTAQAKGSATEIYAAFEEARERMAKQLRRHKRRLKDHHRERPSPILSSPAGSYVLAAFEDAPEAGTDGDIADEEADVEAGTLEEADGAPAIIAETELRVPSLSVGEAVMQMELSHASVLVFRHEKRGRINVVYRREDGNIGWIDPLAEGSDTSASDTGRA